MTGDASAVLTRRSALLERAVGYARTVVRQVRPEDLTRTTPCAGWDLLALMRHFNESVATLREAVEHGCVFPGPAPRTGFPDDVLAAFDRQCGLLLATWDERRGHAAVAVGGDPVNGVVLANTGAVEVAVHAWDVAQACALAVEIPAGLAGELLDVARWVVPRPRRPQFGPEVAARGAGADERLVAFLGRRPLGPVPGAPERQWGSRPDGRDPHRFPQLTRRSHHEATS
jgi:uncharacterized protein (TIGR03086 family)